MKLLQFHPLLKRIRWGGTRLGTVLGKEIDDVTDCAESWEISDHGDDQSIVANGPHNGWTLSKLVEQQSRGLLGQHSGLTQFPLLIKFLDAHDRLSVQVHPNDKQAKQFDPREYGKTEAWVIIDTKPDSRLYVGLKPNVDCQQLENSIADDTLEECLHSFVTKPGDCLFIPAGTVHAIGEGILLAEVQQSSDLTFRLYDWGRLGTDGKPRELHIQQALSCIDFTRGPVNPIVPQLLTSEAGHRVEELATSEYFTMRRHTANTTFHLGNDDRFHIFMSLDGNALFECGDESDRIEKGQTLLIPAEREDVRIIPDQETVLLETYLP